MTAIAVLACVSAIIVACDGELRFEDPDDTPDGEAPVPPPAPTLDSGTDLGDVTTTDSPHDPKRCANDADCKLATLHCDTVAATCVMCTTDDHCKNPVGSDDTKRCDTALHRCVECGNDGDCGASNKKCQPDTHRCVTTCAQITECVTAEAPLCDTTKGFCVRCTGLTCAFTPDTPMCDPGGFCVGCLHDSDCSGTTPRCDFSLKKCVQCATGFDCPGAQQCDPATGSCTG
jgi:hypothetical protein